MQNIDDFLVPSINQIRHTIKGIDDSYNHCWDILAELIQNSVDAIRLNSDIEKGLIELEVDAVEHRIKIKDNGIGISPNELPGLLKPFSTNKTSSLNIIGEKGVGLKYVIFQSNQFTIKTGHKNGSSMASISNARNWKNNKAEEFLPLMYQPISDPVKGTIIELKDIDNEVLFDLTTQQLAFVLRTLTAIGNTASIWKHDIDIDVKFTHKGHEGLSKTEILPFSYMLITEFLKEHSKIDLDEFIEWTKEDDRSDYDKRRMLRDKAILKKGSYVHQNSREIKYIAIFVPRRKDWNSLSIEKGLCKEDNLSDDDWLSNYYFAKFQNGIFLSTKGMPTGISIDHPSTGWAGYWGNIFILLEDPFLKFDIGRKTIHGRQASIHKEYAKKIFNEFLTYVTKYVSGDVETEPPEFIKDEIFDDIEKKLDIDVNWLKFKKVPKDQEASVAAIFYECIGNNRIKDIQPLDAGHKGKYDLYAKWGKRKVVIEFKSKLSNICRDFDDAKKMFDEIDCIVCWEITDDDRQKLSRMQINLEEVKESVFSDARKTLFPHCTDVMNLSGFSSPIYIIDLKKFINIENQST